MLTNTNTIGGPLVQTDVTTPDGTALYVSTIHLMFDHNFDPDPTSLPLLFETMIFPDGKWHELRMWRYPTYELAIKHHNSVVSQLRAGVHVEDVT